MTAGGSASPHRVLPGLVEDGIKIVVVSTVTTEEALARLTADERHAVEEFRRRVSEMLGPRLRDLRIYGSKVRGDAHEESDIDLLVLVDGCDWETGNAIWRLGLSIHPMMLALAWDFEAYHAPINRASPFYREMRKESVRL